VAHTQSAGCTAHRKSVIGAHNKCGKYLLCAITKHWEAKRDFEFIGEDKNWQTESLWKESKIEDILPCVDVADEAERLLGRRRPDSVVVDWANKVLCVLEFKHISDQEENKENGGNLEHWVIMTFSSLRSLEKVARDAQGDGGGFGRSS
jgi:hypothetical protein